MEVALTFDDVALVPQFNNVDSRSEPLLGTWLTKDLTIGIPIIPANMDTVISPEIAWAMAERDGAWIMHRFTRDQPLDDVLQDYPKPYWISVGIRHEQGLVKLMDDMGDDLAGVVVDVAHAHSSAAARRVHSLKAMLGDRSVIAGNVCTPDGYRDLVNAGADAVKVGVGCGAACTTRLVTGFGVPQFTAIRNCAHVAAKLRVPIIADGGIRNSRDIVLAIAAGASSVMMGKMFAACEESAAKKEMRLAEAWNGDGEPCEHMMARYRGQASFDFQQEFYGEVRHAPEGEAMWIKQTGPVGVMLDDLSKQLKAGLTYGGARDIKELQRKAEFVRVTPTYQQESGIRP